MAELWKQSYRPPLYRRLGGFDAVVTAMDQFYARAFSDHNLKQLFARTDPKWLKLRQTQFVAHALGGPIDYKGPSMKETHVFLGAQPRHGQLLKHHLVETLTEMDILPSLIKEILERVEAG